jgi:hypothetical protein
MYAIDNNLGSYFIKRMAGVYVRGLPLVLYWILNIRRGLTDAQSETAEDPTSMSEWNYDA